MVVLDNAIAEFIKRFGLIDTIILLSNDLFSEIKTHKDFKTIGNQYSTYKGIRLSICEGEFDLAVIPALSVKLPTED